MILFRGAGHDTCSTLHYIIYQPNSFLDSHLYSFAISQDFPYQKLACLIIFLELQANIS
jgi:hypothetical protein